MSFDTGYDSLEFGDAGDELGGDSYMDDWTTGEAYDDDAASRDRIRRNKLRAQRRVARTLVQDQRRRAGRAMVPAAAQPPTPQAAVRAVRSADLDSRVRDDMLRTALADRDRRTARANLATALAVTGAVVPVALGNRFEILRKPLPTAALLSLPLLATAPIRSDKSLGGWLRDPRLVGIGGAFAVAAAGEVLNRRMEGDAAVKEAEAARQAAEAARQAADDLAASIDVKEPRALASIGDSTPLAFQVNDRQGRVLKKVPVFTSENPNVEVVGNTVSLKPGLKAGEEVTVVADLDGARTSFLVKVK